MGEKKLGGEKEAPRKLHRVEVRVDGEDKGSIEVPPRVSNLQNNH